MEPHWPGGHLPAPPRSGPPPLPPPKPWDGWYTILWGMVALGVWIGAQTGVALVYIIFVMTERKGDLVGERGDFSQFESFMEELMMNGDLLGLSAFLGAVVGCPVCYYLGKMRAGFSGGEYLALLRPRAIPLIFWLVVTVAIGFLFDLVAPYLVDEESTEAMGEMVASTRMPFILVAGVVLGAPFVEEFIFRGFLWRGWAESALRPMGTLFLTTIIFTGMHAFQYDLAGLTFVFMLGLAIGLARHLTGTLWIPIAMHALNNALATAEMFSLLD